MFFLKNVIYFLILLIFPLKIKSLKDYQNKNFDIGLYFQDPLIYLSDPSTFNPFNYKNSDFDGILIALWSEMAEKLNITYKYKILIDQNFSIDILLYNPEDYDLDKGFDSYKFYPSNDTKEFLKTSELLKENYYIFFPSLLATLIQTVVWQLFFLLFIVIIPWILINTQIYYFFESNKFKEMSYYQGFLKAMLLIICRGKPTKCSKIYSFFFFITTSIISMLILADFIYTIANMLTKYEIANGFDLINTRARVCLYYYDYFQIKYLQNLKQINLSIEKNIADCFALIENLGTEAIIISEFFIRAFFKRNSYYNNVFRFYLKQKSYKTYSFYLKKTIDPNLIFDLNQIIDMYQSQNTIQNKLDLYLDLVKYDKLFPSSILMDSNVLTLVSLTVSSLFILIFMCVGLKRQYKKLKNKNNSAKYYSKNVCIESEKKILSSNYNIPQSNSEIQIVKENKEKNIFHNSITYQKIKKDVENKNKNKNIEIQNFADQPINSELRKLNINIIEEIGKNENLQPNKTLSLSEPISIHNEQNDFNSSIQIDDNIYMENQNNKEIEIQFKFNKDNIEKT